jgi:hypothetical protein
MVTPAAQKAPAPALAHATPSVVVARRPQSPPQALLAQTAEPVPAPTAAATVSAPEDTQTRVTQATPAKAKTSTLVKKDKAERKIERVATAGSSCARMGRRARARCMRPHILRADREMRSAYASATRAGVDRRTLKSYRNRWSRVLEESNSDPVYVTASLEEMTRRLHAKRARL